MNLSEEREKCAVYDWDRPKHPDYPVHYCYEHQKEYERARQHAEGKRKLLAALAAGVISGIASVWEGGRVVAAALEGLARKFRQRCQSKA